MDVEPGISPPTRATSAPVRWRGVLPLMRTVRVMTELASKPTPPPTADRKSWPRRRSTLLLVAAAILLVAVVYAVQFGGCDRASKFCYVGLAGTRSEAVVAWLDGFEVYTQTYPTE